MVSIHAPAWGATLKRFQELNYHRVSIHAPAWGATSMLRRMHRWSSSFQSTRPRGARLGGILMWTYAVRFNPRARVGRDLEQREKSTQLSCFNPRARVGRDTLMLTSCTSIGQFQSTRPRGARHVVHTRSIYSDGFQSTRPRGARLCRLHRERQHLCVSIHAPAWGATTVGGRLRGRYCVSIHAPAWGATRITRWSRRCCTFQSTRPRGARRQGWAFWSSAKSFNPRARVGRDTDCCDQ